MPCPRLRASSSDAHESLKAAIAQVSDTAWQRCRARFMRNLLAGGLRPRLPKAAALVDGVEEALARLAFPAAHRQKIHFTSTLERLNQEAKRPAKVVGIFPNEGSIRRLIGAALMEQSEEWLAYFTGP